MNTIYKVGDKVYDARIGWGVITEIVKNTDKSLNQYPISVLFKNNEYQEYTLEGKYLEGDLTHSLSFSEYDFIKGGFSQERPEELPERGDVVWVRNDEYDKWECKQFMKKNKDFYKATSYNPFNDDDGFYFKYLTTKNPYTNETI